MSILPASENIKSIVIQNAQGTLDDLANKYIIKPLSAIGIGGFVFDYEGETSVNLSAEITDHFTEDNTAIQDHVAIKPVRLTLKGFVSELSVNKNAGLSSALQTIQNKLSEVPAYLGDYTPGIVQSMQKIVTSAQNSANIINNVSSRINNILGLFNGENTNATTKQQKAYQQLKSLFLNKNIFTVETPYEYFDSMVIESLSFIQDETTKYQSDISITLKQIRFANILYSKLDAAQFAGRSAQQNEYEFDAGKQKGSDKPLTSIFYSIYHGVQ